MEKNQKNNSQDFDFSVVEDKIQQVQNIIEKAVKSKDFQEMSQSVTQMVNKTLDQYRNSPCCIWRNSYRKYGMWISGSPDGTASDRFRKQRSGGSYADRNGGRSLYAGNRYPWTGEAQEIQKISENSGKKNLL